MSIQRGDKGQAVRHVQRALIAHGFDISDDGVFGKSTEAAVKEFQRRNGLAADGKVGAATREALGLNGTNSPDIDFTVDETTVPAIVTTTILEYLQLLDAQHDKSLEALQDAVANFETTMQFASTKEADVDLLGSMLEPIFDFVVSVAFRSHPVTGAVVSLGKSLFIATRSELARVGAANISHNVGEWIKAQRTAMDDLRRNFQASTMKDEMEVAYLEADNRQEFFDDLVRETEHLRNAKVPSIMELEKQVYEQWINAHFRGITESGPGCVAMRINIDEFGFSVESCTVETPETAKVAEALNTLIKQLPDLKGPLDLKVRKRVCFFVKNSVGGKSWKCGWLGKDNQLIFKPVVDAAAEAIVKSDWRRIGKFFD